MIDFGVFPSEAAGRIYIHEFLKTHKAAIERLNNVELIESPSREGTPIHLTFRWEKALD